MGTYRKARGHHGGFYSLPLHLKLQPYLALYMDSGVQIQVLTLVQAFLPTEPSLPTRYPVLPLMIESRVSYKASALPLSCFLSIFPPIFLRQGLTSLLRQASDFCDPSSSALSGWDYRPELPCLDGTIILQ